MADGAALSIQQSANNQYLVSWPASSSESFSLYSTTDFVNGPWTPVPGRHALVGDQWQIGCSTSAPRMFFRLQTTLRTDSSNPRYFNNGAGIVFLTGSYWVHVLQDDAYTGPFDYTAYLNFLVANGHNFIRMMNLDCPRLKTLDNPWADVSPMAFQRPGPGNGGDGKPKFDLSKLNQAFFDRLRARVIEAGNRGIYVAYMLFDGWEILGNNGEAWNYMAHNPANNVNGLSMTTTDVFTLNNSTWVALTDAYVDAVVDTLGDLDNVFYEVINEAPGRSNAWQEHVVNRIHAREASRLKQHAVGRSANDWQTTDATSNSNMLAGGAEWVGLSGREGSTYKSTVPDAPATKVSLLDTDHLWGVGGSAPYLTASWVWKCLVRGHNPIYLDVQTYHTTSQFPPYSSDPAVVAAMGDARALASRIDLAHMVPSDATSSTGYALAYTNREYLIYQAANSSFSVTLPAKPFSYEWIDPATGSITQTGIYNAAAGTNTFNLPAGLTNGALLHLMLATAAPTSFSGAVVSFTLINADSEQDIGPLTDGATLDLTTLPTHNLNVRANAGSATVGSVVFMLSGAQTNNHTETEAPYALFGDNGGNYNPWTPPVGSYTLTATPFSNSGGTGTAGTALTINFTVVSPTPTPTPTPTP